MSRRTREFGREVRRAFVGPASATAWLMTGASVVRQAFRDLCNGFDSLIHLFKVHVWARILDIQEKRKK